MSTDKETITAQLHKGDELPDNRRECLVTTIAGTALAKYNENTEKWMIAFARNVQVSPKQIRQWVYVDDIFKAEET